MESTSNQDMEIINYSANDGCVVEFEREGLIKSEYLFMLYKNHTGDTPVPTDLSKNDLILATCICYMGIIPCPSRIEFKPEDFDNLKSLADFMCIDVDTDWDGTYNNDFFDLLGYDVEMGDDIVDEYEGWTQQEIAEQRAEEAVEAAKMDALYDADDAVELLDEDMWIIN